MGDEFFPTEWKFPFEESEKLKNSHYIGQRLYIRSNEDLQQRASICIYVENNWIVIKYTESQSPKPVTVESSISLQSNDTNLSNSILPQMNAENVYKNMEKLHVIKDLSRITK